ncbi:MAG: ATP-binding protein [Parvularculaceae bacterium]|nr:ATP-binding protein [Parvularculaceae bacterium]
MQNAHTAQQFSQFKSALKAQFGSDVYSSYFERLALADANEDKLTLTTPTRYAATIISKRYARYMLQTWSESVSPVGSIDVRATQEMVQPSGLQREVRDRLKSYGDGKPAPVVEQAPLPEPVALSDDATVTPFARGMTFDRFCTNETNRLAFHAAMKLLDSPEPVVTMIHGPAGRGKTHLLNAVAQEWLSRHPEDKVLYLTYDALVTDVCEAFISKSLKEYRTFLQNTDVLLIDDVQMLRGRKRTQEELDCLIERLRVAGKRVLVAGALAPKELAETGISPRLANRLAGGLCVSVEKPDLDLRLKVARQLSDEASEISGVTPPTRHVELLARRCEESIRELEGAMSLLQVATEAEAQAGGQLSDDRVRLLITDHLQQKKGPPTPGVILDFVCERFGQSKEDLAGRSRKQPIVRARHAFCFATRKLTDTPLKAIGGFINRDHTTVMHSVNAAEILAGTDPVFGNHITEIFDEFPQPGATSEK